MSQVVSRHLTFTPALIPDEFSLEKSNVPDFYNKKIKKPAYKIHEY